MSSFTCHRCGRRLADFFSACPHCGAPQDEQSRAASARTNREAWLVILPTALGGLAGYAASDSAAAILGGGLAGLLLGVGTIAVLYARRGRG
jgi:hypothetical protein